MNTKDAYVQKLHAKIDEWNADIDKLTAKAEQVEAESRIEYQKQIEALKTKRSEFEKQVAELGRSGEAALADLKSGLDLAREAMNQAIQSAKARFK